MRRPSGAGYIGRRVLWMLSAALFLGVSTDVREAHAQDVAEIEAECEATTEWGEREKIACMAEKGVPEAQYDHGNFLLDNSDFDYDEDAHELFLRAARQGHGPSQLKVGYNYFTGRGVQKDYDEAIRWYTRAADQGSGAANYNLGLMHLEGDGVPRDPTTAIQYFMRAVDDGHVEAHVRIGELLLGNEGFEPRPNEAVRHFRVAAEEGSADAQFALARAYREGWGGTDPDPDEAVRWCQRAAESGHEGAMTTLREWAEEERLAAAQYQMAMNYLEGLRPEGDGPSVPSIAPDEGRAVGLLREAAADGHADARYRMGTLYAEGRGVSRDPVAAHMYYRLAAAPPAQAGDSALRERADERRRELEERMTAEQIEEAERRAREWEPPER